MTEEQRARAQELADKLAERDIEFLDCGSASDFRALLHDVRRDAFDAGLQLGAQVEHKAAREAIARAALAVLGKDAGDGPVNLGALGEWTA